MARILIVDDEPDMLHLISTLLLKKGFEVQTALSKKELLLFLDSFKPQLIILDVMMKGENGRDICKQIKAAEHRHIPVILYSANPEMLADYQACDADDSLEKPFSFSTLFEKINRALITK